MKIQVSGNILSIPKMCACCGELPDTDIQVSAQSFVDKQIFHPVMKTHSFPYCSTCVKHTEVWPRDTTPLLIFIGFLSLISLLITGSYFSFFILSGGAPIVIRHYKNKRSSLRFCKKTCVSPSIAVSFLGWADSIRNFEFLSLPFCFAFIKANRKRIVNIDTSLLSLLEENIATEEKRILESKNPKSHIFEESLFRKTLSKLESAKGPISRQMILKSSLKSFKNTEYQKILLLKHSKIEALHTIEKIKNLESVSAKRYHLLQALYAINNDDISDKLQIEEITLLKKYLVKISS